MIVEVEIPLRTTTGLNAREHWRVRAARVKRERQATALVWRQAIGVLTHPGRFLVTLTRVSPRTCYDDNLQGGLKAVRDQVAAELGLDDGDRARVRFAYKQQRGHFAVRIRVETGDKKP